MSIVHRSVASHAIHDSKIFLQRPMVNLRLTFTPPAQYCSGKYLRVRSLLPHPRRLSSLRCGTTLRPRRPALVPARRRRRCSREVAPALASASARDPSTLSATPQVTGQHTPLSHTLHDGEEGKAAGRASLSPSPPRPPFPSSHASPKAAGRTSPSSLPQSPLLLCHQRPRASPSGRPRRPARPMGSACGGAAPATGCVNVAARGGLVEAAAAVGRSRRRGEEAMAVAMVRPLPPLPLATVRRRGVDASCRSWGRASGGAALVLLEPVEDVLALHATAAG